MQRLPTSPLDRDRVYISGDVTIHPSAAIAPGVVLQADENSRIAIADGACLGLGVVLHAHHGNIHVNAGANLGAGVLVVGACTIGTYANVGAASTLLDCDVAADCVLPAGSVLGDRSRHLDRDPPATRQAATGRDLPPGNPDNGASARPSAPTPEPESDPWATPAPNPSHPSSAPRDAANEASSPERSRDPNDADPNDANSHDNATPVAAERSPSDTSETDPAAPEDETRDTPDETTESPAPQRLVYGQVHLKRILTTLFPHAHRFDSVSEDAE